MSTLFSYVSVGEWVSERVCMSVSVSDVYGCTCVCEWVCEWMSKKLSEGVCKFGLVSLFNGISTLFRLFNAKAILLEEQ